MMVAHNSHNKTYANEFQAAHRDHEGKSLRDVYAGQCEALQCKKNSYLLKSLSAVPNAFDTLTSLDLSLNFVGKTCSFPYSLARCC